MDYHYPAPRSPEGFSSVVAAPQSDLRWLGLGRLSLGAEGACYSSHSQGDEMGIDILGGVCQVSLKGSWGEARYPQVGQRADPFSGPPSMVYVPRGTEVTITCLSAPLSAALVRAPSRRETAPRLIPADKAPFEAFGRDNWQRGVYLSIGPEVDADRIVMGETHTPSGNWSSYPPHKHDTDTAHERACEEIYHFLFDPSHGFGLQYLWTAPGHPEPPIQAAYPLHNGDTVAIPRGYHPTVVAPGCRMITVWAYAGENRGWRHWTPEPALERLLRPPEGFGSVEGAT